MDDWEVTDEEKWEQDRRDSACYRFKQDMEKALRRYEWAFAAAAHRKDEGRKKELTKSFRSEMMNGIDTLIKEMEGVKHEQEHRNVPGTI